MPRYYLQECIEACRNCASACYHCADSCLAEPEEDKMTPCIRMDLECALLCSTCARVMKFKNENRLNRLIFYSSSTLYRTEL